MDTSVLVSAALVAAVLGVAIGALWARQRAAARELALTAENAKLAAQLETERAAAADKLATLEQNRERLTETFKALSSDALSRNAQQFLTLATRSSSVSSSKRNRISSRVRNRSAKL